MRFVLVLNNFPAADTVGIGRKKMWNMIETFAQYGDLADFTGSEGDRVGRYSLIQLYNFLDNRQSSGNTKTTDYARLMMPIDELLKRVSNNNYNAEFNKGGKTKKRSSSTRKSGNPQTNIKFTSSINNLRKKGFLIAPNRTI